MIVGTVMSSRQMPQSWDALDGTEYVVHIDQKVKGKQTGEITIFSEHRDDAVVLESGKQYLLFLTNNYQHWMVNVCGNSGPMDEASKVIRQVVHANGRLSCSGLVQGTIVRVGPQMPNNKSGL